MRFFKRKKLMPTRVIYEMLFATNLRRLRNPKESGAFANDVTHLNCGILIDCCLMQTKSNHRKEFRVILACKGAGGSVVIKELRY
jgi:hypothetical protein